MPTSVGVVISMVHFHYIALRKQGMYTLCRYCICYTEILSALAILLESDDFVCFELHILTTSHPGAIARGCRVGHVRFQWTYCIVRVNSFFVHWYVYRIEMVILIPTMTNDHCSVHDHV